MVGDVIPSDIKNIFKEYFKLKTFHKQELDVIVPELANMKRIAEYTEEDDVNQTQLTILCNLKNITDWERKYVLPVFSEMLGGSANSILFDTVREKNSYAYYINSGVKAYDNILLIYAGIGHGNSKKVLKLIKKVLSDIKAGKFDHEKFASAKETLISAIRSSEDSPMGIITNYYAKTLVNSLDIDERIKNIQKVSREDILRVSNKINMHTIFTLEGPDEKDNN